MAIHRAAIFPTARLSLSCLCILGLILCLSGLCLPVSLTASAQSQDTPNVRASEKPVTVEVIVLDQKGNPVRNLKRESFRLFENGKEQQISTFDEISESPNQSSPVIAPDIDGGGPRRGKTVLILFDGSNISRGRFKPAQDSAEKYVKDHMKPQDLFAVAFYDGSLEMVQSFTRDADRVLDAIRQLGGSERLPWALTSSKPPVFASGGLLQTLDSLNSELARVNGRKAILLYSEEPPTTAASNNPTNSILNYGKLVNSARMADVAYYTIDVRGMVTLHGTASAQASASPPKAGNLSGQSILQSLAEETWGRPIYNTSDFNQRLDEVDRELSNYYLLGFQSNNPKRDGKFRKLEIKTNLKRVTIKHRTGYFDLSL